MFQFWLAPVYFSFLFFLGSCTPQLEGLPRLRDHRAQKWRTQAKTPFGATPVPKRLPRTLVRLPNYLMASCSLFKRFAQSALVRLPNYLMASCSLLRFVRLTSAQVAYMDLRSASRSMSLHLSALAALSCTTSAQVATWPSTAPIASCRYFNSLSALAAHAPLHPL